MLLNRQFRFPLVLPLYSLLHCIPLRVVRFSHLKNILLPLISFRRRNHFECICCLTDATKTVSSGGSRGCLLLQLAMSSAKWMLPHSRWRQNNYSSGTQVSGSRRWEMLGKCVGGFAEGTRLAAGMRTSRRGMLCVRKLELQEPLGENVVREW